MERKASAVWHGALKDGKGTISTQSGVLKETQYSFSTRFADGIGTNPEELIAAAHAGCFTMALSAQLGEAGLTAESLETTAVAKFEKTDAGFTITSIHLTTRARFREQASRPLRRRPATRRRDALSRGCSRAIRRLRWTQNWRSRQSAGPRRRGKSRGVCVSGANCWYGRSREGGG